jgi:hypothetical protein
MTDKAELEALAGQFDKFRIEWGKGSSTGNEIHSIHVGTDREAVIRASDLDEASTAIRALLAENERLKLLSGRMCDAYVLICDDAGKPYYKSDGSVYAHLRKALQETDNAG